MGFLKFLDLSQVTEHDVSFDFMTAQPRSRCTRLTRELVAVPIPMELVLDIMEAAYFNDDLQPNTQLLRNCTQVCKAWRLPAQKLLFRSVTLRSQSAYYAFKKAVNPSTDTGRELARAVVRMRLTIDPNQPNGLKEYSFARAVHMCPSLFELSLSLYGCATPGGDAVGAMDTSRVQRCSPCFDKRVIQLLESGPKISALQVTNWSDNHQCITQLLNVWPAISSLAIGGAPPRLCSPTPAPIPCELRELRMNFQSPPSLAFVKWLLHNSSNSLRILELERETPPHIFDYLTEAHCSSLESLTLPSCTSHELSHTIKRWGQLKEIKTENPWVSPMIYKGLPGALEHIALGLDGNTALQPVLDAIKTCESLKAITVHVWDGGDNHPQLCSLKIACAYQGIDLRFTHDVLVFRSMIRGDPVPSSSFPRVKSMENLNFMLRAS
jgi:hypothetical protein